jgi:transposase
MVKSDAMRKLYAAGWTVGKIAEHYGVPYSRAYRAVNPPRRARSDPASTARKPLTKARLATMSKAQLRKILGTHSRIKTASGKLIPNPHFNEADVQAASDEGDRRWGVGNWEGF